MKKRIITLLLLLAILLTGCSDRKDIETNKSSSEVQQSNSTAQIPIGSHKVLVAYFSRVGNTEFPKNVDTVASASLNATKDGVKGNSEVVAKMIKETVNGDLFLIQREDKLPENYDATVQQAREQHDNNMEDNVRNRLAKLGITK